LILQKPTAYHQVAVIIIFKMELALPATQAINLIPVTAVQSQTVKPSMLINPVQLVSVATLW
jgi:hypothetical protein